MEPKEIIKWNGFEVHSYLEGGDTNQQVSLFKCVINAGTKMPVPHYHERFDETIYGVKGIVSYTVAGKSVDLGVGDSLFIPRGVVHGFENKTNETIEFLVFINPAVFGVTYFRDLAQVLNAGGPPDATKIKEVMSRHGLVPVMA